jgi:large subunit ribosomal protein LX
MAMKAFRVEGNFKMGHHWQKFAKEFAATDEDEVRERCFSVFGSKHGVPRRLMRIDRIAEVPVDDVVDPVVRHQASQ